MVLEIVLLARLRIFTGTAVPSFEADAARAPEWSLLFLDEHADINRQLIKITGIVFAYFIILSFRNFTDH